MFLYLNFSETWRTFSWKEESRPAWEKIRLRHMAIKRLSQLLVNITCGGRPGMDNSVKQNPETQSSPHSTASFPDKQAQLRNMT